MAIILGKPLKTQIKESLSDIIKPALEQILLASQPEKSKHGTEQAKELSEMFDDLTSDMLADALASCIDYYVRNITITGTIITAGGLQFRTTSSVVVGATSMSGCLSGKATTSAAAQVADPLEVVDEQLRKIVRASIVKENEE